MKRTAMDHPKVKRAGKLLGLPHYAAVGVLECLWHFTAKHAIDGAIGKWTDEEIAGAIGWDEDDAEKLITALAEARLLDRDADHRLIVHDWNEHADDSVHKTLARRCDFFATGHRPNLTRLSKAERERISADYERIEATTSKVQTTKEQINPHDERPSAYAERPDPHDERACAASLSLSHSQAKPEPKPCIPSSADADAPSSEGYPADFEAFWVPTVRKIGKRAAAKAYAGAAKIIAKRNRGNTDKARAWLLERWELYNSSPKAQGEFSPHPSTWLKEGRYDDDEAEWQRHDAKPKNGNGQYQESANCDF